MRRLQESETVETEKESKETENVEMETKTKKTGNLLPGRPAVAGTDRWRRSIWLDKAEGKEKRTGKTRS